jgi:hypothetical protein
MDAGTTPKDEACIDDAGCAADASASCAAAAAPSAQLAARGTKELA